MNARDGSGGERSSIQKTGAEIIDGDDAREIWKLNAGVECSGWSDQMVALKAIAN